MRCTGPAGSSATCGPLPKVPGAREEVRFQGSQQYSIRGHRGGVTRRRSCLGRVGSSLPCPPAPVLPFTQSAVSELLASLICPYLVQAGAVVKQGLEMDQKLDSGAKRYDSGTNEGTEQKGRRLDLSVPQVAGSAVAAIAAAVGASQLDVYGTIIGAGVVSVIATCGGSVFHYLFRRTGEHLRDAADQARPRGRQVRQRTDARLRQPAGACPTPWTCSTATTARPPRTAPSGGAGGARCSARWSSSSWR